MESSAASPPSSSARVSSANIEFAQNVWVNDRNFHELENERDPFGGNHDGTLEVQDSEASDPPQDHRSARLHHRARRRVLFLPGLKALRYLAALPESR